jgi:hypothetical protein
VGRYHGLQSGVHQGPDIQPLVKNIYGESVPDYANAYIEDPRFITATVKLSALTDHVHKFDAEGQ